jgi:hypothetical protein
MLPAVMGLMQFDLMASEAKREFETSRFCATAELLKIFICSVFIYAPSQ